MLSKKLYRLTLRWEFVFDDLERKLEPWQFPKAVEQTAFDVDGFEKELDIEEARYVFFGISFATTGLEEESTIGWYRVFSIYVSVFFNMNLINVSAVSIAILSFSLPWDPCALLSSKLSWRGIAFVREIGVWLSFWFVGGMKLRVSMLEVGFHCYCQIPAHC